MNGAVASIGLIVAALVLTLYAGIRGSRWWLMQPALVLALIAATIFFATQGH